MLKPKKQGDLKHLHSTVHIMYKLSADHLSPQEWKKICSLEPTSQLTGIMA